MSKYTKTVTFVIAFIIVMSIHEGLHLITSLFYNEYSRFVVHWYGFEVVFNTPVALREGFKWFVISGTSNIVTPILGWVMLSSINRFVNRPIIISATAYWVTVFLLIFDPLNLLLNPFFVGGDALGVALGLGVPVSVVQVSALAVFLVNRELFVSKLIPAYGVETNHPLFKPWFRGKKKEIQ